MPPAGYAYIRPFRSATVLVGVCAPPPRKSSDPLGCGWNPGLPEAPSGILGGGRVDVDPPKALETFGARQDTDMPVIIVGKGGPVPPHHLGGPVGGVVEGHLPRPT